MIFSLGNNGRAILLLASKSIDHLPRHLLLSYVRDCPQWSVGHDWKPCKAKVTAASSSCDICLSTSHTRDSCPPKKTVASSFPLLPFPKPCSNNER